MFYGVFLNVFCFSFGVVGLFFVLKEFEFEIDECFKDIVLMRIGDLIYGKKFWNVVYIVR